MYGYVTTVDYDNVDYDISDRSNRAKSSKLAVCLHKLGESFTVVGRVTSLDDEANAAIIEDHERVVRHIKLPPQSSSLDIVKNQVYIFYGVVTPLHDGSQDKCLEVTRFTSVKDVDLPLYGSCAKVRRQIVKEMDEVVGNTLDEILSQLDQECQVFGDWKDGVRRLVANEQQSDTRENYQSPDCPRLDPGMFVCGSDPDDRKVKKKVSFERLAMDIVKKVYEEDCARGQDKKVHCPTKLP